MAKSMNVRTPATPGRIAPQLHLKVIDADINSGCQKDASICMIAQAILRTYPQAQFIRVDAREVAFSDPSSQTRVRYFNSAKGALNVIKFDRGDKDIKPFALNLHDGVVIPMGWKAKHPGSTRKGKIYKRTGRKVTRYTKFRHYGACNIKDSEAEVL